MSPVIWLSSRISSSSFLVNLLGFSTWEMMLYETEFPFFFSKLRIFYHFSLPYCTRTSSKWWVGVMNASICATFVIVDKKTLSMILALNFHSCPWQAWQVSFYSSFAEYSSLPWVLNFSKCYSCIYWNDHMVYLLCSVGVIKYIDLCWANLKFLK